MGKQPLKIQSNIPLLKGEAVIIEDEEHLWAVEIESSPLTRAALNMIQRERKAGEWETINPNLKRARKKRG